MNLVNFKRILDKIKADPTSWNQSLWHCKTAHCFAGHGELLLAEERPEIVNSIHRQIDLQAKIDIEADISKVEYQEWLDLREQTGTRASLFLQLTEEEAEYLFASDRTLEDFEEVLRTGELPINYFDGIDDPL